MTKAAFLLIFLAVLPILVSSAPGFVNIPIVDPCASTNTDCTACLLREGCGYCQSTQRCQTGNANGPGGFRSNCTEWVQPGTGVCEVDPCAQLTNCRDCLNDELCGWCTETNTCFPGDEDGPLDGDNCRDRDFLYGDRRQCNPTSTTGTTGTTGSTSTTGGGRTLTGFTTNLSSSSSLQLGFFFVLVHTLMISLAVYSRF